MTSGNSETTLVPELTSPSTTRPISTAGPCQNGGYFNGFNCTCLPGFSGSFCQFVDTVEPDKLNRSVVVNVMINQKYDESYDDKTSAVYKEFVANFTERMEEYYQRQKIANFKEVLVTSVSRGDSSVRFSDNTVEEMRLSADAMAIYSITSRAEVVSVTHDVVLAIPNNSSAEELYVDDLKAVEEAANKLVRCTSDCPYNVTAEPTVNGTDLNLESVCQRFVDDPEHGKYYEAVSVDGAITCVTVCNSHHSHPKTCYNNGNCRVYRDIGPLCECQNVNDTWYLGNDCRLPIQRTAFYVGLSVTLACLIVTVGALTAYVLINKHKQTRRRDIKKKVVNQWLNEDVEWSRSNSSADTYNSGDYRNPSFTYDESASHREDPGDYRQPVPVYQLTRPSSQTAPRHNTPFSNIEHLQSASPALPHRDISSNQLMRISRPQIRSSIDV
ncbi:mucin-3B-like [Thunnus albacares]|uniref:mucin-3B-like n=1 Tax=Thunnus albacares TaxID=8236 RepID=UPI001CF66571|nr:mucin-3B-like [Thunnus albacares]